MNWRDNIYNKVSEREHESSEEESFEKEFKQKLDGIEHQKILASIPNSKDPDFVCNSMSISTAFRYNLGLASSSRIDSQEERIKQRSESNKQKKEGHKKIEDELLYSESKQHFDSEKKQSQTEKLQYDFNKKIDSEKKQSATEKYKENPDRLQQIKQLFDLGSTSERNPEICFSNDRIKSTLSRSDEYSEYKDPLSDNLRFSDDKANNYIFNNQTATVEECKQTKDQYENVRQNYSDVKFNLADTIKSRAKKSLEKDQSQDLGVLDQLNSKIQELNDSYLAQFLAKYYPEISDDQENHCINIKTLVQNLNQFFVIKDETINKPTYKYLKKMFGINENNALQYSEFCSVVEDYQGLLSFYLNACQESIRTNYENSTKLILDDNLLEETNKISKKKISTLKSNEMKSKEINFRAYTSIISETDNGHMNTNMFVDKCKDKLFNTYELLMENFRADSDDHKNIIDKKLRNISKLKKDIELARKSLKLNDRATIKSVKQDHKKMCEQFKKQISELKEKNDQLSENLKFYKLNYISQQKKSTTNIFSNKNYMEPIKHLKKVDNFMQTEHTKLPDGTDEFISNKKNALYFLKKDKRMFLNSFYDNIEIQISLQNWKFSSYALLSLMYFSETDGFYMDKFGFVGKSLGLFLEIAKDEEGSQALCDIGILDLLTKQGLIDNRHYSETLLLFLQLQNYEKPGKMTINLLGNNYWVDFIIEGILKNLRLESMNINIIEQGLLILQRLSSARNLELEMRKKVLNMCKMVKNCVDDDKDKIFRFILINLNSILSNLS